MPTADPNVLTVACPGCGAKFRFLRETAGHKTHCAKCGTKFLVPRPAAPDVSASSANAPPAAPPVEQPEYIGFECHLCQTRMYGRIHQVGKAMKCPDCGAQTVVPPPPPPKPKNMPAALEGEQYELWGVDEAPLPSELVAQQPKFIAIPCRNCATLMYADEKQVGQTISCPDCGTKHAVTAPAQPKRKESVLARDFDTPKLDPAADPGERLKVQIAPRHKMVYEERQEAEYARALEKSRRTGKPMEIDARGRPVMPAWPLLTGVLPFLVSEGVPVRWFAFSAALIGSLSIILYGVETAMAGGFGAIAGMCFFVIGSIFAMLSAAGACSALMAILIASSEGNREVQYWPGIFDWFGDLLTFCVAAMTSAVPGGLFGRIPGLDLSAERRALLVGAGTLLGFPIVLLSQLDINSPWGVLSPRVLSSLGRCPGSWLLFYLESAALAGICGAVTYYVAHDDPQTAIWLVPLYLVAAIVYARLLGRLGWRLAEATPAGG